MFLKIGALYLNPAHIISVRCFEYRDGTRLQVMTSAAIADEEGRALSDRHIFAGEEAKVFLWWLGGGPALDVAAARYLARRDMDS